MFSLHDRPSRLCDGISRRELIRVGGLSMLGLSLPQLVQARTQTADEARAGASFGKAKNVIFLWLQGGPPQHETFDPKPDAPAEIRGEFKPIATNVPGIQICELLPRTAAIVDKLAIVRSLCTHSDLHDASGYWVLTGYQYKGQQSRQINRSTDWPYLGSVLKMLAPSPTLPSYTSVWLPDVMRLNDNVQPAGQTAGFMGFGWDPQRVICDPSDPKFQIEGLTLPPEIPPLRLSSRQSLLEQVERHFAGVERGTALRDFDRQTQEAFGLLTSGRARQAFDLSREPAALRERYGRHKWGQSVLLARRLVEAGARLVHVNWPREGGDEAVSNPLWDTHAQNADRLQDVLCPQFDVTFTALIEDLEQRGLLVRNAGRGGRRVRPHAEDQCPGRPRPLGARLQLCAGRRGDQRGAGLWIERQARRLSARRPDRAAGADGDDSAPAGRRPHGDVPRRDRPAVARHARRTAVRTARGPPRDARTHGSRRQSGAASRLYEGPRCSTAVSRNRIRSR